MLGCWALFKDSAHLHRSIGGDLEAIGSGVFRWRRCDHYVMPSSPRPG